MFKLRTRWLTLLLALALAGPACSGEADGPLDNNPVADAGSDVGLDADDNPDATGNPDVADDRDATDATDATDVIEPPPRDEPLDRFVADRTGFDYDVLWSDTRLNVDAWLLDVTSGHWRTEEEVDRTLWTHEVLIAAPKNSTSDTVLVVIEGGSNRGSHMEPDDEMVDLARVIALRAGTPVVGISQIPNQPLTIVGEEGRTYEDDLVAASWHKVLETGDPTWSAYFPMTRGAVRVLDAVQAHLAAEGKPVDKFVVTGFSKRGATTYLATAADERIIAMAPGVFDFLNFRPQAQHHMDVYGEPAPAVRPYADYDMLARVHAPEAEPLLATSDPYAYRARYTMPKLILASPGDEFFLPDAMQFYIDDLPGETLVRYVPNTGHGLVPAGGDLLDVLEPLVSWYRDVISDTPRPDIAWTHDAGTLTVTTDRAPTKALLWTATNPEARNFRNDVLGPVWESTELTPDTAGAFTARVTAPDTGFTAYFIELTFGAQVYSTQVYVTPDE